MEVLRIEGLTKRYGRIKAIDQLSLTVHSGQVMGLLGPNGSGKTTTLGIILDILKADAGTYRWFEGKYAAADARKRIGSILERPYFYPHLSADENLEIVRRIKDLPPMSFDEVLDTVGLLKRRHSPYRTYSLGMKQRLAVASTLLGDPEVLIFDEPTNGLDPEGIIEMREIIIHLRNRGKTVFLASHILDEVEKICTHVTVLQRGKVLASGPLGHIITANKFIVVSASQPEALHQILQEIDGVLHITRDGSKLIVEAREDLRPEEINRTAAQHGIWLSHLEERRMSLEEEFLKLVKKQNTP